jgi:hypothetical protein
MEEIAEHIVEWLTEHGTDTPVPPEVRGPFTQEEVSAAICIDWVGPNVCEEWPMFNRDATKELLLET